MIQKVHKPKNFKMIESLNFVQIFFIVLIDFFYIQSCVDLLITFKTNHFSAEIN